MLRSARRPRRGVRARRRAAGENVGTVRDPANILLRSQGLREKIRDGTESERLNAAIAIMKMEMARMRGEWSPDDPSVWDGLEDGEHLKPWDEPTPAALEARKQPPPPPFTHHETAFGRPKPSRPRFAENEPRPELELQFGQIRVTFPPPTTINRPPTPAPPERPTAPPRSVLTGRPADGIRRERSGGDRAHYVRHSADGGTTVNRLILIAAALSTGSLGGCASTWDAMMSRDFRKAPFKSTFSSEDPMTVLRTKVDGDARAKAMRRLKEPAADGKGQAEQDEALAVLTHAATRDPSPILRIAAVDALGRFKDPRALPALVAAYHKADGLDAPTAGTGDVQQTAAREAALDPTLAFGPLGHPPEFVFGVRARVIDALAASDRPEAVRFLADVATGQARKETDGDDQKVRVSAVRGLGRMRHKESVVALAKVLQTDGKRDIVMSGEAHQGLVNLTGKQLPADGDKWAEVVQAGFVVQPEPSGVRRVLGSVAP